MDKRSEKRAEVESRLQQVEKERRELKGQLDRDRLLKVTGQVVETITSPEFVERMRAARAGADRGEGLDAAAKLLSIEGLREAGCEIPDDFRLTSRVFEDKVTGTRIDIEPTRGPGQGPIGIPEQDPLGWGACAGGGGLTFCGCGGFSTAMSREE